MPGPQLAPILAKKKEYHVVASRRTLARLERVRARPSSSKENFFLLGFILSRTFNRQRLISYQKKKGLRQFLHLKVLYKSSFDMVCVKGLCLALAFAVLSVKADPESAVVEEFPAEHRGAKPEPFIDRLVSLFSSSDPKRDKNGKPRPVYPQRPVKPYGPPPRPGPVRKRPPVTNPQPPRYQQAAPSNNLPTYVSPGSSGKVFKSIIYLTDFLPSENKNPLCKKIIYYTSCFFPQK